MGLGYQFFNNEGITSTLPDGISQEVTLRQSLSRNSVDNPLFPTRGSQASLSLDLAMPFPGAIQYHKWRFRSTWNVPLVARAVVIAVVLVEDVVCDRHRPGQGHFQLSRGERPREAARLDEHRATA